MNKKILCLATAGLLCAAAAQAQSAGTFIVRAGGTTITPDVDSADLTAPSLIGTKIDVKKASQVSGGITYMWTDNIAIDVPIAPPFKHDVVGDGAIANVGKLGTVKSLPFTVMAQYRFGTPTSTFRPYVGAGGVYAKFFKPKATAALSGLTGGTPANPTLLSMKSVGGPAIQAGLAVNLGGNWSLDVDVKKVFLKTTGRLSTGQTIETTLDPLAVSVGIAYSF